MVRKKWGDVIFAIGQSLYHKHYIIRALEYKCYIATLLYKGVSQPRGQKPPYDFMCVPHPPYQSLYILSKTQINYITFLLYNYYCINYPVMLLTIWIKKNRQYDVTRYEQMLRHHKSKIAYWADWNLTQNSHYVMLFVSGKMQN